MTSRVLSADSDTLYALTPATTRNAEVDPNDILTYKLPDPSTVLVDRQSRFVKALATLESYAEGYRTIATTTMKSMEALNGATADAMPSFESSQANVVSGVQQSTAPAEPVDQKDPVSLNFFFGKLREDIGVSYSAAVELENKLSTTVLPELKSAQQEYEKKRKELSRQISAANKEYSTVIKATAEANNDLNTCINAVKVKGKVEYKKDPFLVKRGLLEKSAIHIRAANDRVDLLQRLETSAHQLEIHLVTTIQRIFRDLATILTTYYGSNINTVSDINTTMARIDPELSWKAFCEKNQLLMVSNYVPSEPGSLEKGIEGMTMNPLVSAGNPLKRDFKNVVFNNQYDPLTTPVLEGTIHLREGLLKKEYKSIYAVITPAHYLFGFPTKTVDNVEPALVIYLPDSDLREDNADGKMLFTLKGKDKSNLISRSKTFRFKAGSDQDFATWVGTIAKICGGASSGPMSD